MKFGILIISILSFSFTLDLEQSDYGKPMACPIQEMTKDTILYYYTWGLAPKQAYTNSCEQQLQKKYGFAYKVVAGCVISNAQMMAWMKHNTSINTQLDLKWGTDWKKNFDLELEQCSRKNRQE